MTATFLRRALARTLVPAGIATALALAASTVPTSTSSVDPADLRLSAAGDETLYGFTPGKAYVSSRAGVRNDYDRVSGELGSPDVYRYFHSGLPGTSFKGSGADFGPPVVVSFKASPTEISSGRHDARLRSWFGSIPTDRTVWWSYYHEPEDQIERGEFTAAQYRAAWRHLLTLAPERDNLRATMILMQWTLDKPSRSVDDYMVPGLDVLAWDAYLTEWTKTTAGTLDEAAAVSERYGLGYAVAEVSVTSGRTARQDRGQVMAQFIREMVASTRSDGAEFVTWFEINKEDGDWRMAPYDDAVAAWRSTTTATPNAAPDPELPYWAYRDPDHDGLTTAREWQLGTRPWRADSDGDGMNDGREVALGRDPLRVG
ncbi:thrombospondin type 3 repeat-containing protein [Nocardioides salarius]|uniref:thrombospondin type 3 repeat-containing protein n=1 Tax=Nocardioides salarius TaxID=374513 RepID=UPI0030F690D4